MRKKWFQLLSRHIPPYEGLVSDHFTARANHNLEENNNLVCPVVEGSNIGLLDYIQWLPDLHNTVYVQFLAFLVKGT